MQNPGKPRSGRWDEDQAPKLKQRGRQGPRRIRDGVRAKRTGMRVWAWAVRKMGQGRLSGRPVPNAFPRSIQSESAEAGGPGPSLRLGGPSVGSSAVKG